MRSNLVRNFLFALGIGFGVLRSTFGDILFIDLNGAKDEVAAAQRAAAARHEKLIVIPDANQNVTYFKPSLFRQLLNDRLSEFEAHGTQISSLVVSGHDGVGSFFGDRGRITGSDLKQIFEAHPKSRESVRSMYLWGCYALAVGELNQNWRLVFPDALFIAGFDGSAPSRYANAGQRVLESMLMKESKFMKAHDQRQLLALFRAIPSTDITTSAAYVCDQYITHSGIQTFQQALGECAWSDQATELTKTYECYLEAQDEKCRSVPENTQSSPLRELYNYTVSKSQCSMQDHPDTRFAILPQREDILKLIFFNTLWNNFLKKHGDSISAIDANLKKIGAPPELLLGDLSKLSRGELVKKLRAAYEFVSQYLEKNFWKQKRTVPITFRNFRSVIMTLDDFAMTSKYSACIPVSWVEPGAQESSHCEEDFQKDFNLRPEDL